MEKTLNMDKKVKLFVAGAMLLSMLVAIVILAALHKSISPSVYIVLVVFIVTDSLIIFVFLKSPAKSGQIDMSSIIVQEAKVPYSDSLISVDDEGITIKQFYFPYGAKRVNFSDIEFVQVLKGGCMRLWGSDDFSSRTWYGLDWERMDRPMRFVIRQKNKWRRVGFTCENSEGVAGILRSKNLLQIQ